MFSNMVIGKLGNINNVKKTNKQMYNLLDFFK